jgi:hypothetical protein
MTSALMTSALMTSALMTRVHIIHVLTMLQVPLVTPLE